MATAAAHTVAQVSRIVHPGEIDPENVVTPGIFVQAVVRVAEPAQEEDLNRVDAHYPKVV
jgi:3-oxoadipate CoA-transferase alpha subunit